MVGSYHVCKSLADHPVVLWDPLMHFRRVAKVSDQKVVRRTPENKMAANIQEMAYNSAYMPLRN